MSAIYDTITNQIIKAIEEGAGTWQMPWKRRGMPTNVASKKGYNGINILALWISEAVNGFGHQTWGTYNQWKELGGQVKKGEKGTSIVFFNSVKDKDKDKNKFFARGYTVFNVAQVEGYKEEVKGEQESNHNPIDDAENFFQKMQADLRLGGDRAFYSPTLDFIQVPKLNAFTLPAHYYSTVAHEFGHWTGHKSRLNRDLTGRFGEESYAIEELVAELNAAFICGHLGIDPEPRKDHAQYIDAWIKRLRSDNRAIFTAASKAQESTNYLIERAA